MLPPGILMPNASARYLTSQSLGIALHIMFVCMCASFDESNFSCHFKHTTKSFQSNTPSFTLPMADLYWLWTNLYSALYVTLFIGLHLCCNFPHSAFFLSRLSPLTPSCTKAQSAFYNVASLVECYEMVLAVIMSVPENVWDECYRTCSSYLHTCYCGY